MISTKSHKPRLLFEPFNKGHYKTYLQWFENETIRKTLYNIDEEWLDFVLNDTSGIEYAVLEDGGLVAVVGIELPTGNEPYIAIKNIAVHPGKQRKGIGQSVLEGLYKLHSLEVNQSWLTFVEVQNLNAKQFFLANKWKQKGIEDDMIRFEKK